jgi:hypothetical protein
MAHKGNRNYARGRAREEELARLLRQMGYEVERSTLSGQSGRHRRQGAGWDLLITVPRTGKAYTVSVKSGKSLPVGIYRVRQGSGCLAGEITDGTAWWSDVAADTVRKMRGLCDLLAVKRTGARFPWVWLWLERDPHPPLAPICLLRTLEDLL